MFHNHRWEIKDIIVKTVASNTIYLVKWVCLKCGQVKCKTYVFDGASFDDLYAKIQFYLKDQSKSMIPGAHQ